MTSIHAVLRPSQVEPFVKRFDLAGAPLETSFDGWHKRAILAPDRVFLFPRHESDACLVEREVAALRAVDGIDLVPRLLGLHDEKEIYEFPFLETERRFGRTYESIEESLSFDEIRRVLASLGEATAAWHAIDTATVAEPARDLPSWHTTPELLAPGKTREALEAWWSALDAFVPSELVPPKPAVDTWEAMLVPLAELDPVLTHGDVHETQIFVDGDFRVTTVLDWDHAAIANPVRDFNFGEWGFGIFGWEERFDALYESYWEAYRAARGIALPDHRSVLLFRSLWDAVWLCDKVRTEPESWFHAQRLRRCLDHIANATE